MADDGDGSKSLSELSARLRRASGGRDLDAFYAALQEWGTRPLHLARHEESGKGPLHFAAWKGRLEHVEKLVATGCGVEDIATGKHSYGKTPLFFAITQCRNDIVASLLELGASTLIVNNKGQTPLSLGVSHLCVRTCSLIRERENEELKLGRLWREFHTEKFNDGLVYGDRDPRFSTPLKGDVTSEFAINPTSRASRRNNFLRNNPGLVGRGRAKEAQLKAAALKQEQLDQAAAHCAKRTEDAWQQLEFAITNGDAALITKASDSFVHLITQVYPTRTGLSDAHDRLAKWIANLEAEKAKAARSVVEAALIKGSSCGPHDRKSRLRSRLLVGNEDVVRRETLPPPQKAMPLKKKPALFEARPPPPLPNAADSAVTNSLAQAFTLSDVVWVDTIDAVKRMNSRIAQAMMEYRPFVAVDTEWMTVTDEAGRNVVKLATVQLAVFEVDVRRRICCFVVDAVAAGACADFTDALDSTLTSCVTVHGARLAGFAFQKDAALLSSALPNVPWGNVVDVQDYAVHVGLGSAAQVPSLKRVVEAYGVLVMDKSEQRSNWATRPLRPEQLLYAALDAVVLLEVLARMGVPAL